MTHAELVEQVARSIYESRNGHGCKPWVHQPKAHQQPYLTDATAAIAAVREALAPLHDKVRQGLDELWYADDPGWDEVRAMLDASPLKEVDG
jgi:hypothetical protein